ncbi:MAG: UDP-N-acetylmuramyl-tripeptide synthetase [Anaerovoracaceae bacterium]
MDINTQQKHLIKDYVKLLEGNYLLVETQGITPIKPSPVTHITFDSKDVKEGTLFVAKGVHFKKEYLDMAMAKSAQCCLFDEEMKEKLGPIKYPYIVVSDIRKAMSDIAAYFYNNIYNNFKLIGITGTKGKSTTTFLLKSILDKYAKEYNKNESAVVSGITNYDGIIREESHLTTPEAFTLYNHFNNAYKSNIEFLTMEVSSQALKYHRTRGIIFDIGGFLNIGEDHISDVEHPNFDDYVNSKLLLMNQCKTAVINMDDEFSHKFLKAAKESSSVTKIITFGTTKDNVDLYGFDITPSKTGIEFKCKYKGVTQEYKLGLPGIFNVSNGLCAIAIAHNYNIPYETIRNGLLTGKVDGRMELFRINSEDKTIIVDYAHNKLSFESLFKSTKEEFKNSQLTVVFGCPGNKGVARRHELPKVVAEHNIYAYITEEDYGEENLEDISKEVYDNLIKFGGNGEIINDREEAITKAISKASNGSVILITGKGRETRQKRGTKYIDVPSDVEIVEELIKGINNGTE